jgi:hypothetical protein
MIRKLESEFLPLGSRMQRSLEYGALTTHPSKSEGARLPRAQEGSCVNPDAPPTNLRNELTFFFPDIYAALQI